MKTKFGLSALVCLLFAVFVLALTPASGQAGTTPNDNGDRLRSRDRDHVCSLDVPDQDCLQIRDRLRERDPQHLLGSHPPFEENDGDAHRRRIQERAWHMWKFTTGPIPTLIWSWSF